MIESRSLSIIMDNQPITYKDAIYKMQCIVAEISENKHNNTVWLLEHAPIYTSGYTTFHNWVEKYGYNINGVELVESERGGQITFHGPGQRICYLMVNLKSIYGSLDLSSFLSDIHQLIIDVLVDFNIEGIRDKQYPGVWVKSGKMLKKIAAIGIKIKKSVSYHGFALNVNTDMRFFNFIEPCGISETSRGVTSIYEILKTDIKMENVDKKIQEKLKILSQNWNLKKSLINY